MLSIFLCYFALSIFCGNRPVASLSVLSIEIPVWTSSLTGKTLNFQSVLSIFCRPGGFCRFICGNCPVASRASADRWLLLVATSGGCPVATSGNLGYAAWLGKFQKIWESQSLFPWSSIAVGWEGWKKTDGAEGMTRFWRLPQKLFLRLCSTKTASRQPVVNHLDPFESR